jgi:hypothetical protein
VHGEGGEEEDAVGDVEGVEHLVAVAETTGGSLSLRRRHREDVANFRMDFA